MASIKVKFRPSSVTGKEGCIYYQIIQNHMVRQLRTNYRIYAEEWNKVQETVLVNIIRPERYHYLLSVKGWIQRDLRRLEKISDGSCSSDEIIRKFQCLAEEESFFAFMERVIIHLEHLNRERTVETYKATFRSFFQFHGEKDVLLDEMTSDLMQEYEAYLKARGITMNTVSFYMRILRAGQYITGPWRKEWQSKVTRLSMFIRGLIRQLSGPWH